MQDDTITDDTPLSFRDRIAAGSRAREGSEMIGQRITDELARRAYSAGYAQALLDIHLRDRDGIAVFLEIIAGNAPTSDERAG